LDASVDVQATSTNSIKWVKILLFYYYFSRLNQQEGHPTRVNRLERFANFAMRNIAFRNYEIPLQIENQPRLKTIEIFWTPKPTSIQQNNFAQISESPKRRMTV
jgi:hypothetical protein